MRQGKRRTPGAAKLSPKPHGVEAPKLPVFKDPEGKTIRWSPRTRAWWRAIWASPMAPEFLPSDTFALEMLARLEDEFDKAETPLLRLKLAGEIRLQRQSFGLTPMDRRRLQWEVSRVAEKVEKREQKRASKADPRAALTTDYTPKEK
jgi:hypothetical protein